MTITNVTLQILTFIHVSCGAPVKYLFKFDNIGHTDDDKNGYLQIMKPNVKICNKYKESNPMMTRVSTWAFAE